LQLLVTLMSNMIGRVDRLVPQSPIGPVSTMVVISFVFASTAQFFWVAVLWTVRRSQSTDGVVGNIARCCGKKMPRLCKAVEVGGEEERTQKMKVKETETRSGAHNHGRRSIARAMARGMGRAGTIKGSLRYAAKVALHLKRGIGAVEDYTETSAALQRKLDVQRANSRSRLRNRIQSRVIAKEGGKPPSSCSVCGAATGPEVRFCTTCGTGRGNEDGASSDSPLSTRSPQRAQQRAHTAVAPKATTLELPAAPKLTLSAEQSDQPLLPYTSARPNETKARAFFKSLGLVRTEQLLAKMAAVVEERGRGTPDKLLGALLRKKMQVQDVATVLVEMRACSDGGMGGEITAEGVQRWVGQ
jgi:hypothetical protein